MDGAHKPFVSGEAVDIPPVLQGRFKVDAGRGGHPVSLLRVVKLHQDVANVALHALEPEVRHAGINRGGKPGDSATGFVDPYGSKQRKRVVLSAQLQSRGRGSTRNAFKVEFR